MINVLLAEDHLILRDGIKALFENHPQIRIAAEAGNGREVLSILNTAEVDVLIADINMPVMDGIETTKYIRENHKGIKVLILSMMDHEKYITQCFEAGALGYILKTTGKDELINAVLMVAKGEPYISHKISMNLIRKLKSSDTLEKTPGVELSPREIEVLNYISEGLTNIEIADKTFTSKRTIETHRKNLIEKTKTRNTASLIKFALKAGLLK